ncbi:SAF domain-containing protein, partial [Streptococcus pneumoniae]|uniref:SAF domain-containing protein n=1 Tax=Streptococcus pneumoniae TaxID=1313 RepID=UPI0013282645|nr:pseudaminic acid synthase [Streptococcus pneumoniae]
SLYFAKDLQKGDTITTENVRTARPSKGLSPIYLVDLLGKTVNCDISRGTPVTRDKIV